MNAVDYENPWIRDVQQGRIPAWAVVLVAGIITAGVLQLAHGFGPGLTAAVMAALAHTGAPWPEIAAIAGLQGLLFGLLLVMAVLGGLLERRRLWRSETQPVLALLAGIGLGGLGFCACAGVAWLAGAVSIGTETMHAPILAMLAGAGLVAFQSTVEEVVFRGWLQPLCCARWGPWLGLIGVSLLFAMLHVAGGARSPAAVVNLFLGGMMFGLLALRCGGLWAAAGAHFAWNWTESGLLGLDPNPGVAATGAIFDLDLVGPSLWSGGADTLNGSLAVTLVLLVIASGLMALAPRGR